MSNYTNTVIDFEDLDDKKQVSKTLELLTYDNPNVILKSIYGDFIETVVVAMTYVKRSGLKPTHLILNVEDAHMFSMIINSDYFAEQKLVSSDIHPKGCLIVLDCNTFYKHSLVAFVNQKVYNMFSALE